MANTPNHILNAPQLGELLGCTRVQVYRLVKAGKIPGGFRLGTELRWTRESILDWARERERLQAGPVIRGYQKRTGK